MAFSQIYVTDYVYSIEIIHIIVLLLPVHILDMNEDIEGQ